MSDVRCWMLDVTGQRSNVILVGLSVQPERRSFDIGFASEVELQERGVLFVELNI